MTARSPYTRRVPKPLPKPKTTPAHQEIDRDLDHLIRDVHRLQRELLMIAQAILSKLDALSPDLSAIPALTDRLNAKAAAVEAAIIGAS